MRKEYKDKITTDIIDILPFIRVNAKKNVLFNASLFHRMIFGFIDEVRGLRKETFPLTSD